MLFDPRVSSSLLGHFVGAISGSSIARKTSFLQDKVGVSVFAGGVTIVDERLAREYWPDQDPIGKRIRFGPPEDNEPWHTIVGVVGEVKHQRLDASTRESVYLPFALAADARPECLGTNPATADRTGGHNGLEGH